MCGIAGYYAFDGRPGSRQELQSAIGSLRHRGPDALRIHVEDGAALAHARLSVIDLEGGSQPVSNEDQSLWVVANGEIYNFVELREELEAKGHRFSTRSDTEVILHLYEEEGEDCVRHLNGQWAFAVWDRPRRRLFLSRDRFGVRPIYFAETPRRFLFGSEAKALFAFQGVPRELDPQALDQIFTFWVPIAPATIFKGVRELPAGHSIRVDAGGMRLWRHWRQQYSELPTDEQEGVRQLLALLEDAVRLRLRSDVPVGAYLSGGLDSSLVAALIRKFNPSRLKTFSIAFEEQEFDESPFQRRVAEYLGTEHHELRCTTADIGRAFPEVIWHAERPFFRTAPAPLYLLSRQVHDQGYKVVLTGEGADEILAGYDIYKIAKVRRYWAQNPESVRRPLLLRRLCPYLPYLQGQSDAYLRQFFRLRPHEAASPLFSHLLRWDMTSKLKLFFSDELRNELRGRDAYEDVARELPPEFHQWNWLSRAQFLETEYLLPGYILASQGDRMAMAHSVETRFPFLDPNVAEFAFSLPARLKMQGLREKHLLRRCGEGLVPETVLRRAKQPYRAPEAMSLLGTEYAEELLQPSRIRGDGVFCASAVRLLVEKAREGRAVGMRDNMAVVGILSTQILIDRFIRHAYNDSPVHC
ncbi:MAG: asparagine synthase (glutamine-hydrolyzing) [Bryobacterales bacterium]|nr:asparagine synthase (glutamine-hydrolyzing) [Bryobacterales bacterium]